ncbi:MAG: rhodanese-like domain-containing protein [Bacilli bacterium]|nr:rhodanese-like domain-containing protein [Bacilli bacterium]
MISNISVSDFLKQQTERQVIDIRSIQSYNNNHIPGAKNIPKDKLLNEPQKYLNRHEIYYIYCQSGIRSKDACRQLLRLGYKVININGGYESWMLEK